MPPMPGSAATSAPSAPTASSGTCDNVCPNCGGGFTAETDPPGDRVAAWPLGRQAPAIVPSVSDLSYEPEEIATFSARLRDIPPERR